MTYLLKDGMPTLALIFALPLLFSHVEEKKMKLHKKNAADEARNPRAHSHWKRN